MDTVTRKSSWGKAQTMLRAQHDCPHGPEAAPVIQDSPSPEKGEISLLGSSPGSGYLGQKEGLSHLLSRRRVEAPVPEACIVLRLPSWVPLW